MADSKSDYSAESTRYIKDDVPKDPNDFRRYYQAQNRKNLYDSNWKANAVNINDIFKTYLGDGKYQVYKGPGSGIKYIAENKVNKILCDKVGGYVRIQDKKTNLFYTLKGILSDDEDLTHFKIKKRKDM